jgi:hypothetical protein
MLLRLWRDRAGTSSIEYAFLITITVVLISLSLGLLRSAFGFQARGRTCSLRCGEGEGFEPARSNWRRLAGPIDAHRDLEGRHQRLSGPRHRRRRAHPANIHVPNRRERTKGRKGMDHRPLWRLADTRHVGGEGIEREERGPAQIVATRLRPRPPPLGDAVFAQMATCPPYPPTAPRTADVSPCLSKRPLRGSQRMRFVRDHVGANPDVAHLRAHVILQLRNRSFNFR